MDQCSGTLTTDIRAGLDNLSIFYVDDDENNLHALGALMDNWGCSYASAISYKAALVYAREHPAPDVILMDYQLGTDGNGIELATTLKETWPETPVCIVSAAPNDELLKLIDQRRYGFLRKPIKPGKLRALLEKYLERKSR
jgi:CheY-like chemotaxis protein